jgi:hypothetical protein
MIFFIFLNKTKCHYYEKIYIYCFNTVLDSH